MVYPGLGSGCSGATSAGATATTYPRIHDVAPMWITNGSVGGIWDNGDDGGNVFAT